MSGFSAEWLALREPHDADARDATLIAGLRARSRGPRAIVDLGAGTGANLRWLAPWLGGAQRWLLVDHDRALLAAAEPALRAWAEAAGTKVEVESGRSGAAAESLARVLVLHGPQLECRVQRTTLDLARDLASLEIPSGALVTSSALLDLVSPEWLETLARRCRSARADACFALTYDGRTTCTPAEPEDATVLDLFNRHQRGDKGFGPALGPTAARWAQDSFADLGYRVTARRSDWKIAPRFADFQRALLAGWLTAALEIEPERRGALQNWHRRRLAHVDAGHSGLTVGHVDFVATGAG